MIFHQILLHIFSILNNERTVSSAYHLLKGKRSGQTIQDVGIFKLHNYFGLLPKLKRPLFDEAIEYLKEQKYIEVKEDGFYSLNPSAEIEKSDLYFNGWRYRGQEHIFFSRLALLIETLSHVKKDVRYFAPTEKNVETQQFIRQFLKSHDFKQPLFRQKLFEELHACISKALVTDEQRDILVKRLSGVEVSGFTWKQLAYDYELEQMDVYFLYISALHSLLEELGKQNAPYLQQLAVGIETVTPLTDSAKITANLMQQGYSVEQIATARQLKSSTIEDHIVEMAMNISSFSIEPFMSQSDYEEIVSASEMYQTKKLRILKEVLPQYSYFQLRLALAKGE